MTATSSARSCSAAVGVLVQRPVEAQAGRCLGHLPLQCILLRHRRGVLVDLKAVRLLAERTREIGAVAYRYAMEGRVTTLAMLLLVVEEKMSAPVSVVIEGIRTKKSIYNSFVDEALSIGDASAQDNNERRKALLCEIQLLNSLTNLGRHHGGTVTSTGEACPLYLRLPRLEI